ncbi:MAG TPA: aldo/keto reductase [Gaiellaceae bacterium]|nr:aldo/keto reductase [Gaiellaceae bacterium]
MLDVSRLVLGCGNFGGIGSAPAFFGQGETREQAFALMDAAWEVGIRRFDTADAYGGGRSERWIGEWMRDHDRRPALTTKVFHSVVGDPADRGLAPDRVRRRLHGSLERLGVDAVDLYLTHEPDPDTPIADTLAELARLRDEGLVRAFGLSNVDAAELEAALDAGDVSCVQNAYSLLDRDSEPVLEACAARGIEFQAFGPLAGGWLTRKYRRGEPPPTGSRMTLRPEPYRHLEHEAVFDALDRFAEDAAGRGTDTATLALAWLLADPRVGGVVLGPRRPAHLAPALAAASHALASGERDALAALFG